MTPEHELDNAIKDVVEEYRNLGGMLDSLIETRRKRFPNPELPNFEIRENSEGLIHLVNNYTSQVVMTFTRPALECGLAEKVAAALNAPGIDEFLAKENT